MRLFLVLFFLWILTTPALALESERDVQEFSSIQLIAGALHTDGKGITTLDAGVDLKLGIDWKTYWRSPGDTGFPMTLELADDAQNVDRLVVHWPYPKRFIEEWGLEVFGFKDHVLLPVTIILKDAKAETHVRIHANYAVCSDICINQKSALGFDVMPSAYKPDSQLLARLKYAWQFVPVENGTDGLKIESASIRTEKDAKGTLAVAVSTRNGQFYQPDLFVEGVPGIRFPQAKIELGKDRKHVTFVISYELSLPAKSLKDAPMTLTLVNARKSGRRAIYRA